MEDHKRETMSGGSAVMSVRFPAPRSLPALIRRWGMPRGGVARIRFICCWLIMMSVLWTSFPAQAQPEVAKFARQDLQFYPYQMLVEEQPEHLFIHGNPLRLTIKPTEKAEEYFRKPFLIRMFRVEGKGIPPASLFNFLPCEVFFSAKYDYPYGINGNRVQLSSMEHLGWLMPMAGGILEKGKFLLVFESYSNNDRILRLDFKSKKDYFASGLYIEIGPSPNREYRKEVIDAAARDITVRADQYAPAASANEKKYYCFNGVRRVDGQSPSWDTVAKCDDGAVQPDGFGG